MLDPGITRELVTASGNQNEMPALNDTSNVGVRLAENTAATSEGDLVFTQKLFDAYKYSCGPISDSSELFQDSALPFEHLVRDSLAEQNPPQDTLARTNTENERVGAKEY